MLILSSTSILAQQVTIGRYEYTDKLRGMWLGECLANWTGIQTEGDRVVPQFYTDDDWSAGLRHSECANITQIFMAIQ